ncbi:polymorphic toxin-type HINT domain-containing protein [Streptomyces sp. NPDC055722]
MTHTDHDFVDLTIKATAESGTKQAAKDGAKAGTKAGAKSLAKKTARKAAFGLAASAAVLGALAASHGHGGQEPASAPVAAVSSVVSAQDTKADAGEKNAQGAHLTTTFHHPFYDKTQSAFVEAKDLKSGDVLQTPSGTAEVTDIRLYHANTTTYDLTIGTLHTYYVDAGGTPVLVHNCGTQIDTAAVDSCRRAV